MSNRRKIRAASGRAAPPTITYPERDVSASSARQLEILAALPQPLEGTCMDCGGHLFVWWEEDSGRYGWRQYHRNTCPLWRAAAAEQGVDPAADTP